MYCIHLTLLLLGNLSIMVCPCNIDFQLDKLKHPRESSVTFHVFYFQAPVLQASCYVIMDTVSLRHRAVTSSMTAAIAQMKRTVGLLAPLRMVIVAGKAPRLIILIGREGLGLSASCGHQTTTRCWMLLVCLHNFSRCVLKLSNISCSSSVPTLSL